MESATHYALSSLHCAAATAAVICCTRTISQFLTGFHFRGLHDFCEVVGSGSIVSELITVSSSNGTFQNTHAGNFDSALFVFMLHLICWSPCLQSTDTRARACVLRPFFRDYCLGRYQKGKTNLDFTEARQSEWQWHQLGHKQVCISLQTDNHASTPPLEFFTGQMPFLPPNQQCQSTVQRYRIQTKSK